MNQLKNLFFCTLLLCLSSCANYINQMHSEFDRADGLEPEASRQSRNDQFNMYRQYQQPSQNNNRVNSSNNPYVAPATKRRYTNSTNVQKRYKANDLVDNKSNGSLWGQQAQSQDNYLFTSNDKKTNGDIILIKVEAKMKDEITAELKRAFPSPVSTPSDENGEAKSAGPAPASAPAQDNEQAQVVYDRVSSVVVEEINKDHLLLRGRKNVLYKNRKRVVEIQALISRRDIASDDTVLSDRIIENNISVIR